MMKKAIKVCVILLIIGATLSTVPTMADVSKLNLEVIDSSGNWDDLTPMYLKTSDNVNTVYAAINATNINATQPLKHLQYVHWIFDYINYSDPAEFSTDAVDFCLEIEFNSSTYVNVSYNWIIEDDGLETTYTGELDVFVDETHLVDVTDYGVGDTHQLEFHLWRSKSNQIIVQWKLGDAGATDRALGGVFTNWDIKNFTYTFQTNTGSEMYFTCAWEDLAYQCGSDEGIADPISNENWGVFEPIRQVLLFVLRLFLGIIDLILPAKIEAVFDHFLDNLSDYIDPFVKIIVWIGENWLDLLILIHLFLLVNGVEKAYEGQFADVIIPFWRFWGGIFNIIFKIMNFVVSIIKAVIEALPF